MRVAISVKGYEENDEVQYEWQGGGDHDYYRVMHVIKEIQKLIARELDNDTETP